MGQLFYAALLVFVAPALGCQAPTSNVPIQPPSTREDTRLEAGIRRIIARPEFRHSEFGIDILSLDTGRHLYRLNAEKFFAAGSTAKLLTAATALEVLGEDFRFQTRVYRTGPILGDGTLDGDIVLVASGDPNLSGRVRADGTLAFSDKDHDYLGPPVPGDPLAAIRGLSAQVAAKGIKRVRGRVLVDTSLYPEREAGGFVVSPFAVNDHLIDIVVRPGASEGSPAVVVQSPATSYLKVVNRVTTSSARTGLVALDSSGLSLSWGTDMKAADGTHEATLNGSIAAGRTEPEYFPYLLREPRQFGARVFAQALTDVGVACAPATDEYAPDFAALAASYVQDRALATHTSVSLSEEIRLLLKVSQNLHAHMIEAVLGAQRSGETTVSATDLKRQFLERLGVDRSSAQKGDAAGGDTHFTPEFMVSFLARMAKHPSAESFQRALPVLGRDGTLAEVQRESPAAGHVFAKTGTNGGYDPLNQRTVVSKALAGYLTTAAGRRLAFAVYARDIPIENWTKLSWVSEALGEMATVAYATADEIQ